MKPAESCGFHAKAKKQLLIIEIQMWNVICKDMRARNIMAASKDFSFLNDLVMSWDLRESMDVKKPPMSQLNCRNGD